MQRRMLFLVLWAMCLVSCGASDLIRNPTVERWCGDDPCDWQVKGEVRRVGTWHPKDYAVELVGDDAALVQENAKINYRDSDCFSFAMVAFIPDGVKVFLELDFLADGSVEFSQRLPVSDWERRTFKVSTPSWYSKVRFIIRKEGAGRATLAEISAVNADRQCSAPPVELLDRPEGAVCAAQDECAEGIACAAGRCGGCANDDACEDGKVCALRDVDDARFKQCVARAEMPFGAACDRDEQCETAVCADGACSECADDRDCDAGSLCLPALNRLPNSRFWPRVCGAGAGKLESGEPCTAHRDCASSECQNLQVSCELLVVCRSGDPLCFTCAPELQRGECR